MARVVRLDDVWAMLRACAPGCRPKETDHHWAVTYQGKTYRRLPLGSHGRRHNPEIEAGHVRQMVRFLGIEDCARRRLPDLYR